MVVSTSLMTGEMSSSAARRSMEMFSSALSSSGDDVEGEAFGDFVENALRLLGLLEQVGDLGERGDA